jgi:hypothetical protein
MITWILEGKKKRGRPRRNWRDGIYTAMNGRDLGMSEWNNRRQWNMEVGRRRQTFENRVICTYKYGYRVKLSPHNF